jgi:hypothetical protein
MTAPTRAELQEAVDRIASRFDYGLPVSNTVLVQVAQEAARETGHPCYARIEEGNKLVIHLEVDPEPGLVSFTVVASPPKPSAAIWVGSRRRTLRA